MTLPADAQAHLEVAFQLHIPEDDIIPATTRYRMFAERVVCHPLPEWQALTVEEARAVYKRLYTLPALPSAAPETEVATPLQAAAPEPPPWMDLPHSEHQTPNSELRTPNTPHWTGFTGDG